jgi:WD40 repeat protein
MDFSEAYKFSGPSPIFSPDGRFLASVVEYRLIIREAETLSVVQLYSCLDRIDSMEWSPNSMYILCGLFSRAMIQVWSVEQSDWTCKIDEGPAGVQARNSCDV